MQPTDVQVQRTLAALEVDPADPGASMAGRIPRDTLELLLSELPVGLLAELEGKSPVRSERLERARSRLADGTSPSDDELAGRIVGRLVCDRLR
jgi:hypothetical protein